MKASCIRVGSRDSKLAVVQATQVMEALEVQGYQAQLCTMKTTGDRILDRTLAQIGGKGLFVKELDIALREHRIDISVHSLKDMPMDTPHDLPIVAVSKREDVRDVLVLPAGCDTVDVSKPIGCASIRRQIQLKRLFPHMELAPVRGNLQTRLQKLDRGEYAALVLAAAGLHRLGLSHRIHRYFTPDEILPAAGQAIIAVQSRQDFDTHILHAWNCTEAWHCMLAERAFVHTLDGGCSMPMAAYASIQNDALLLQGMYVSPDLKIVRQGKIQGSPSKAETLGKTLANQLRAGENVENEWKSHFSGSRTGE